MSPDPRISVTHLALSLDVGGLERVVLDLAREGRSLGQDVTIACLERPGALADEARAMSVAVDCAGKRPGLRPSTIGRLATIFRRLRPEVVHTHQVGALAYAGPAARLAGGIPLIHTEHSKQYASRVRTRLLGRLAAGFADRFACVSADIAEEVIRCRVAPRRKVVVVPNGIEVGRFADAGGRVEGRAALGIPAEAPVIGTVGRLDDVKRQDRLILGMGHHRPLALANLAECVAAVALAFGLAGVCVAFAVPATLARGVFQLAYGCKLLGLSAGGYCRSVLPAGLGVALLPWLTLWVITTLAPPRSDGGLLLHGSAYTALFGLASLRVLVGPGRIAGLRRRLTGAGAY